MSDSLWPHVFRSPGSSVHGILQARILKWVAIPFSGESSWPRSWSWVSFIADRFFFSHTPHLVISPFSNQGLNLGFLQWEVESCWTSRKFFYVCVYNSALSYQQRRKWQPTPVFLPGKSHEQRSLASCSPWVTKSWIWLNAHTFPINTYYILEVGRASFHF